MTEGWIAPINGSTKLVAIVGDPIKQVGSPGIVNPRFTRAKINAVLIPVHIPQENFEEGIRGLKRVANLAGIIITVPFKHRAAAMVDRMGDTAKTVDGINALRREPDGTWSGDMFDGEGLVRAVEVAGRTVKDQRVLLLGAGGAGTAIAMGFAAAGCRSLTLSDPEAGRAAALADRVKQFHPGFAIAPGAPTAAGHDIILNASPVGMKPGEGLPAPIGALASQMLVIDIIPYPEVTPLISEARAAGCQTIGGLAMLEAQCDTFLEYFGLI
ncbi:shikimate dehydrogenase family protein [Leptospira interrogans]